MTGPTLKSEKYLPAEGGLCRPGRGCNLREGRPGAFLAPPKHLALRQTEKRRRLKNSHKVARTPLIYKVTSASGERRSGLVEQRRPAVEVAGEVTKTANCSDSREIASAQARLGQSRKH